MEEDPPPPPPPPRLRIPDDVLAGVLGRLSARSLAVSRCVCREWRAIADDRCRQQLQLRRDLLPRTVGGIFVASPTRAALDFFARPSMSRRVDGRLECCNDVVVDAYCDIEDCCNGLALLKGYVLVVVNPATRRSARLPLCDGSLPVGHEGFGYYWSYLAFDPTVSSHYEVIAMQHPYNHGQSHGLQWPPSVYVMRAYSSRTGRWEERRFALEHGEGTGIQRRPSIDGFSVRHDGHAAYWRGLLYVHCNSRFILRINLSEDKYQVIDLPADAKASNKLLCEVYLGKSKNGIYFAAIDHDTCRVLVWFLDESDGKTKAQWLFKHGISKRDLIAHFWGKPDAQTDRPWILQDHGSHQEFKLGPASEVERDLDWDSGEESAVETKGVGDTNTENTRGFVIFGFHPYKEIVFLFHSLRVVAYHFGSSSSKAQDLGELRFTYPDHMRRRAFVYTPCWVGDLSDNN